jgi:hypothetical protein
MNRGDMRFGVEIEIGSDRVKTNKLQNAIQKIGWVIVGDGSVSAYHARPDEYRSKIYEGKEFQIFKKDVRTLQEFFYEYNHTMGYHIHVSFRDRQRYTQLFCGAFVKAFLKELIKYSETLPLPRRKALLNRWDNSYCKARYDRRYFENMYEDTRYHAVNFIGAWGRHRTVEFRIFPSSKSVEELIDYTKFTLNFVLDWVKDNPVDNTVGAEKVKQEELKAKIEEEIDATPIKTKIGGIKKCALHG